MTNTASARADTLTLHYLTVDQPKVARTLLKQCKTAAGALAAIDMYPSHLNMRRDECRSRFSDAADYASVADARAASINQTLILENNDAWPTALNDLDDAPLALYAQGNVEILPLWGNALTVCGSRSSTAYGNHVAQGIASAAAQNNLNIITGGGFGIEAAAIASHLVNGNTSQIVVLASGTDLVYPSAHSDLFKSVLNAGGVLVSEFPPGSAPHHKRFLARNRLIAAAGGIVIVEAAARSGALAVARHALVLGRPLGAVPGPTTSITSVGCHNLIRDGHATLIRDGNDALALLAPTGN